MRGKSRPRYKSKIPDSLLPTATDPMSELMNLTMEQKQEKLGELWKVFGMNTAAGKSLFNMFGNKYKKKISYPKPKRRKWSAAKAKKATNMKNKYSKKNPARTKIEYPPVVTKSDIARKKMMKKFSKLDLLPKKRGKVEIMKELEERRRNVFIPENTGKDRIKMTEDLQDKFKYANDPIKKYKISDEEDKKIKKAMLAQVRKAAANNYFYTFKKETGEDKTVYDKGGPDIKNPKLRELNGLFDAVCAEIEERQTYLKEIELLDMPEMKDKVKKEIVERVSELQKINKLIKKEREENGS